MTSKLTDNQIPSAQLKGHLALTFSLACSSGPCRVEADSDVLQGFRLSCSEYLFL